MQWSIKNDIDRVILKLKCESLQNVTLCGILTLRPLSSFCGVLFHLSEARSLPDPQLHMASLRHHLKDPRYLHLAAMSEESPNCSSITLTLPTFPIFPNFCVAFTTTSNTSSKLANLSITSPLKRNNQEDTSQSLLSSYSRPSLPCLSCVSGSLLIFVGFNFFTRGRTLNHKVKQKNKTLDRPSAFQGKTTNIRHDQALLFVSAHLQEDAWQAVLKRLPSRKDLFLHFENPANACLESL